MSTNYDLDQLLGTYADWIVWLKEKEASLQGQLARMRGKRGAGKGEQGDAGAGVQGEYGSEETPEVENAPEMTSEEAEIVPSPSDDLADEDVPPSAEGDENAPQSSVPRHPSVVDGIPPGEDDTDDWL